MIRLPNDFKEFLQLLHSESVEYLLVGGYAELDGVQVTVISLEMLKANKRASGRLKDLADLESLP